MNIRSLALGATILASLGPSLAHAQTDSRQIDPAEFAALAASSNMFEIESSNLALAQSQDDTVRAFAQHMITDHTAAGEKMKAAAAKDGITPQPMMAAKEQAVFDKLKAEEGGDFDEA